MYQICFYFLMFFCYSVLGWLVECICCTLERKKPTFDRGFLVGPYCPIYGYGAMYMYFFLSKYKSDFLVLFIMAIVGTSTIEFFTSYFMEKIFKARWKNLSQKFFLVWSLRSFIYLYHKSYLSISLSTNSRNNINHY